MKIDLRRKKASGWAFKEAESDRHRPRRRQVALSATSSEPLAAGTVRETPEGWCVDSAALARWFGIGVKPMTSGSAADPRIRSQTAGRAGGRAASSAPPRSSRRSSTSRAFRRSGCPIACGARRRSTSSSAAASPIAPATGVKVDRQRLGLCGRRDRPAVLRRAAVDHRRQGIPNTLRLRAYRSDPDGGLLGPLEGDPFRLRRRRRARQPADRNVRQRPRRDGHQPPAVQPGRVRPHPVRGRSAERLGRGTLSQRRAAGVCQADRRPALSL